MTTSERKKHIPSHSQPILLFYYIIAAIQRLYRVEKTTWALFLKAHGIELFPHPSHFGDMVAM